MWRGFPVNLSTNSAEEPKVLAFGDDEKIYMGEKVIELSPNSDEKQATENLKKELEGLSVIMFKDESRTLAEILGAAGITHIVSCCECRNVELYNDENENVLEKNNETDKNAKFTANEAGRAKIGFSVRTGGCTFHKTTDTIDENELIVNVVDKPELKKATKNKLVFKLDETNIDMDYEIGSIKGSVDRENKTLTFDNLSPITEYTIVMRKANSTGEGGKIIVGGQGSFKASTTSKINHQHDWTYSTEGNVITATCMEEGIESTSCSETDPPTLTLDVSECKNIYDGSESAPAKVTESDNWSETEVDLPTVYYKGTGETVYEESTTPPTNAGTYEASITIDEATATAPFTIAKGTQKAEVIDNTFEYGTLAFIPKFGNIKEEAEVKYYYNTTESNEDGTLWDDETSKTLDAGTYYVYAEVPETDNYESFVTDPADFEVTPAFDVKVANYNKETEIDGIISYTCGPYKAGKEYIFTSTEKLTFKSDPDQDVQYTLTERNKAEGKLYEYSVTMPQNTNKVTVSHVHNYDYKTDPNKKILWGTCKDERYGSYPVKIAEINAEDKITYNDDYDIEIVPGNGAEITEPVFTYYKEGNVIDKPTECGKYTVKAYFKVNNTYFYLEHNYEIAKRDISFMDVSVDKETYDYDGEEKTPVVTVSYKVGEDTVTLGEDDFSYTASETDAGEYTITIIGKGDKYCGEKTVSWSINAINMGDIEFADDTVVKYEYNGKAPEFKATGGPEDEKTTYTYTYYKKNGDGQYLDEPLEKAPTDAGEYLVKVTVENPNYNTKEKSHCYTILKKDVTITPESKEVTYGTAKDADGGLGLRGKAKGYIESDAELFKDISDMLTADGYDSASGIVGKYQIKGKDFAQNESFKNYNVNIDDTPAYVTVKPILMNDEKITVTLESGYGNGFIYTGDKKSIVEYIKVEYADNVWGSEPAIGTDYRIIGNVEKTNVGTYIAQIDAQSYSDNYDGRRLVNWKIVSKEFGDIDYSIEGITYGDELQYELYPDGTVANTTVSYEFFDKDGKSLGSSAPTDAGEYEVTATISSPNYADKKCSASFTISPKKISAFLKNIEITYGDDDPETVVLTPDDETEADVTFECECSINEEFDGETRPVSGDGYTYSIGKVTSSDPNYTLEIIGDETGRLTVKPRQLDKTIVELISKTTTINPVTEDVAVEVSASYKGKTLTEGTDYTLGNDVCAFEPGKYEVDVIGKGNFTGTITYDWYVNGKTYTYTLINGTFANGKSSAELTAGEIVTVKADPANDGYRFGCWKKGNDIVSYNQSYIFKVTSEDTEIKAIYVDASDTVAESGTAAIDNVEIDTDTKKIKFNGSMSVKDNCKILKVGFVATSDASKAESLSITNNQYNRGTESVTAHNCSYAWTKTITDGSVDWYVKSYVTYEDETGAVKTVYSEMKKANLRKSETVERIVGTAVIERTEPEADRVKFTSYMSVPMDCKINRVGIVATLDSEQAAVLSRNNCAYDRGVDDVAVHNCNYSWTKTKQAGETCYVKPYIMYTQNGKDYIVYGETVEYKFD